MATPADQRTVILVNVFVARTVKLLNAFAASCESKLHSLHLRLVDIDTRVTLLEAQIRSTGLHTANGRAGRGREAPQKNLKASSAAAGSTVIPTVTFGTLDVAAATSAAATNETVANPPATELPVTTVTTAPGSDLHAADSAAAGGKLKAALNSDVPATVAQSVTTPDNDRQNQPGGNSAGVSPSNAITVDSGEATAAAVTPAAATEAAAAAAAAAVEAAAEAVARRAATGGLDQE
ncbi:hypothetical protein CLOP_g17449 [Closterium sp. NIES-67]|nr:hypothetical protein CLOP_g17449 [Closterium sp. NIES-67]